MVLGTLLKETKINGELCRGLSKWVTRLVCDLQSDVETGGMNQVRQRLGRGWVEWGVAIWGR